jgi:hypothetical protein
MFGDTKGVVRSRTPNEKRQWNNQKKNTPPPKKNPNKQNKQWSTEHYTKRQQGPQKKTGALFPSDYFLLRVQKCIF